MINRIVQLLRESREPVIPTSYCWVETATDAVAVTRRTARGIERALDRWRVPKWVVFRDVSGARHRWLASQIVRIVETTARQRSAARAFQRSRRSEEQQDEERWKDE